MHFDMVSQNIHMYLRVTCIFKNIDRFINFFKIIFFFLLRSFAVLRTLKTDTYNETFFSFRFHFSFNLRICLFRLRNNNIFNSRISYIWRDPAIPKV